MKNCYYLKENMFWHNFKPIPNLPRTTQERRKEGSCFIRNCKGQYVDKYNRLDAKDAYV